MEKKYIVYKITTDFNDSYYIGIHKTDPAIDDGYRGSGYYLTRCIEKYGKEHFKRDTLFIYDTLEEASNKGRELVNDELLADPNCMNLTYGGGCGWSFINKQIRTGKMLHPMQGKHHSNKSREKIKRNHANVSGSANGMYRSSENWITYNNGITNISVRDGLKSYYIPNGFKEGKFVNRRGHKIEVLIVPDIHSKRYILDKFIELFICNGRFVRFDKVIFLGDYGDGFVESNEDMLYCLNKVIELKKTYPDKIVLLLANHEISYMGSPCSGHRYDIENTVQAILMRNRKLFQVCYAINDCLISHAGVTNSWLKLNGFPIYQHIHDKDYCQCYDKNFLLQNISNFINNGLADITVAGAARSRGIQQGTGSPIWADKSELLMDWLPRYNQIVGHTPVSSVAVERVGSFPKNYLAFTDTFSTYRDGTIYGDFTYLVYNPSARSTKDRYKIEKLVYKEEI